MNKLQSLKYTQRGYIFIAPEDDCNFVVDAMLLTGYSEEFCIALSFETDFITRLMEAGFLVMSAVIKNEGEEPFYLALPKLHLERTALFFENLHIKKSIRKFLDRYELRADAEFERIVDNCVAKHGEDWLSPPLIDCIKKIRSDAEKKRPFEPASLPAGASPLLPTKEVYPTSFGLYRNGELLAGEFGVVCGKVYTSYSGYYDEDNAGTVQLILATRYLQKHGFDFFDLGMPLNYKNDIGAVDITPQEFVYLFRKGQTLFSSF